MDNGHLFGTSGIRDIFGQSLTTELCRDVSAAVGTALPPCSHVCIATDTRISGPAVKEAVTFGLASAGINVTDLGILPTPALALVTRGRGFATGVMITASHNPAEYNGIKLFNADGIGYDKDQEADIERVFQRRCFRINVSSGRIAKLDSGRAIYFNHIKELFAGSNLNCRIKILVDPGNGAAAGFASDLFAAMCIDVTTLNDTPDGCFPGRNPEPREDTLGDTIKSLNGINAELAVCFDGDADRVVFCDRQGFLGYNEMIAYISRIAIIKNSCKKIVATIDTGHLVDLTIADIGGIVIRSKTGDINVAQLTKSEKAAIGVEPAGVYVQPELGYFPDPIFATLTLLDHIKESAQIRDFFMGMPSFYFRKSTISYPNHLKAAVMRKLTENASSYGASRVSNIDGLKLEYEASWMLLRASGTESVVRVITESTSAQKTDELLNKGIEIVRKVISAVS